ncbi:RNA-guided endonuclease TnpB family protein [Acidiphilium sp. JA12-A1]|uniref:RNA-guided endonuclease InsQ/TnpB family protein n=1 Tax=Acidiphilium sp. JA12-A1 TaxID=1464546 RepID=UPI000460F348|nr:RNA-guided endonuclease TnpB family protein [Acidiphilium sp. JA12-A1]KDM68744.1 putative transposase InsQ for insertion sequence element IS609 [Acidiphilium sp. JA12-A1]
MLNRAFRYKLKVDAAQDSVFRQYAGVVRLIYNVALEQRSVFWRQHLARTGKAISVTTQCRELTALRAEYDWIRALHVTPQQQALRDLDKALGNFFAGRADYPKPRSRRENNAFRFQGREVDVETLSRKWARVRLPKIGWVKFRLTRPLRGTIKNVTVALDPLGWHVSFACAIEHEAAESNLPDVGMDRGVAITAVLSSGDRLRIPGSLALIEKRRRQAQKIVARRKRGSNRRAKALRRVAKLSAKSARIRRHWQHRVSQNLASRFGTVVVEDLKVRNMTASAAGTVAEPGRSVRQKSGLNRSILEQGWHSLTTLLEYKLSEHGGHLVAVDPRYTSQTCSSCGVVDPRSRKSQARFQCVHCGFRAHADYNAAVNVLRRNTAPMLVEGCGCAPVEARTGRSRMAPENPPPSGGGRC